MAVDSRRISFWAKEDTVVLTDIEGRPAMLFGKDDSVSALDILNQRADDMEERSFMPSQVVDEALSWIEKRLAETFGNNVSLSLDSQTGQLTAADLADDLALAQQTSQQASEETWEDEGGRIYLESEGWILPMAPQPDIRTYREVLSLIVNADGTVSLPLLPPPSEAYRRSHPPEDWSEGGLTKIERFTSGGAGTVTVTAPVQVNVQPATEPPKSVQTKSRQSPVGFKHPSTKHTLDKSLSVWGHMGYRCK